VRASLVFVRSRGMNCCVPRRLALTAALVSRLCLGRPARLFWARVFYSTTALPTLTRPPPNALDCLHDGPGVLGRRQARRAHPVGHEHCAPEFFARRPRGERLSGLSAPRAIAPPHPHSPHSRPDNSVPLRRRTLPRWSASARRCASSPGRTSPLCWTRRAPRSGRACSSTVSSTCPRLSAVLARPLLTTPRHPASPPF
jgi:hypothetical protein